MKRHLAILAILALAFAECVHAQTQTLSGVLVQTLSVDGAKMPTLGGSCFAQGLTYQAASAGNGYSATQQASCTGGVWTLIGASGNGAAVRSQTQPTSCTAGISPAVIYNLAGTDTLYTCGANGQYTIPPGGSTAALVGAVNGSGTANVIAGGLNGVVVSTGNGTATSVLGYTPAGQGSCPAGQYMSATLGTPTCAPILYSQISGIPTLGSAASQSSSAFDQAGAAAAAQAAAITAAAAVASRSQSLPTTCSAGVSPAEIYNLSGTDTLYTCGSNGQYAAVQSGGTGSLAGAITGAGTANVIAGGLNGIIKSLAGGTVTGVANTADLVTLLGSASGQASNKVLGTCGSLTSYQPCSLTPGDLPAIPYSQLTGTPPIWNQNTTGYAAGITGTISSSKISDFATAVAANSPVQSVAGHVGAVTLSAGDIAGLGTAATTNSTAYDASGAATAAQAAAIAAASGVGNCTSGQYATATRAGTSPACAQVNYSQLAGTPPVPSTISGTITNLQVTGLGTAATTNSTAYDVAGAATAAQAAAVAAAAGVGTCTAGQYATATRAGTTPTCAVVNYSQLGGTPTNLGTPTSLNLTNAVGLPLSTGVSGTLQTANGGTGNTTGNAPTATALASTPSAAGTGLVCSGIQANGNCIPHQVSYSELAGTAPVPTTISGTISNSQVTGLGTAATTNATAYDTNGAAAAAQAAAIAASAGVGSCTTGQYATATQAGTTPTCSQVTYSQLGGAAPVPTTISGTISNTQVTGLGTAATTNATAYDTSGAAAAAQSAAIAAAAGVGTCTAGAVVTGTNGGAIPTCNVIPSTNLSDSAALVRTTTSSQQVFSGPLAIPGVTNTGLSAATATSLASGATITPTSKYVLLTGTSPISTITPPAGCTSSGTDCEEVFLIDSATGPATFVTGGNLNNAANPAAGATVAMIYHPATSKWFLSGISTATALAATPTQAPTGQYCTGVAANGNCNAAQVQASQIANLIPGVGYTATAAASATSLTLAHNLNTLSHVVQCVNTSGAIITPTNLTLGLNSDTLTFTALAASTNCTATAGAYNPASTNLSDSTSLVRTTTTTVQNVPIMSSSQTNNVFWVDGTKYTTATAACAAAGLTSGTVIIPSTYAGTDTCTPPANSTLTVLDYRASRHTDYYLKRDFGAKGDQTALNDLNWTSGTGALTSQSYCFVAGDVGKEVLIQGAGTDGYFGDLVSYIYSVSSCTANLPPGTTVSTTKTIHNGRMIFGTDDAYALTQFFNTLSTNRGSVGHIEAGIYVYDPGYDSRIATPHQPLYMKAQGTVIGAGMNVSMIAQWDTTGDLLFLYGGSSPLFNYLYLNGPGAYLTDFGMAGLGNRTQGNLLAISGSVATLNDLFFVGSGGRAEMINGERIYQHNIFSDTMKQTLVQSPHGNDNESYLTDFAFTYPGQTGNPFIGAGTYYYGYSHIGQQTAITSGNLVQDRYPVIDLQGDVNNHISHGSIKPLNSVGGIRVQNTKGTEISHVYIEAASNYDPQYAVAIGGVRYRTTLANPITTTQTYFDIQDGYSYGGTATLTSGSNVLTGVASAAVTAIASQIASYGLTNLVITGSNIPPGTYATAASGTTVTMSNNALLTSGTATNFVTIRSTALDTGFFTPMFGLLPDLVNISSGASTTGYCCMVAFPPDYVYNSSTPSVLGNGITQGTFEVMSMIGVVHDTTGSGYHVLLVNTTDAYPAANAGRGLTFTGATGGPAAVAWPGGTILEYAIPTGNQMVTLTDNHFVSQSGNIFPYTITCSADNAMPCGAIVLGDVADNFFTPLATSTVYPGYSYGNNSESVAFDGNHSTSNAPQTFTATTSTGSNTLTGISPATMPMLQAGYTISGPGIPSYTYLQSVNETGYSAVMSSFATASASASLTVYTPTVECFTSCVADVSSDEGFNNANILLAGQLFTRLNNISSSSGVSRMTYAATGSAAILEFIDKGTSLLATGSGTNSPQGVTSISNAPQLLTPGTTTAATGAPNGNAPMLFYSPTYYFADIPTFSTCPGLPDHLIGFQANSTSKPGLFYNMLNSTTCAYQVAMQAQGTYAGSGWLHDLTLNFASGISTAIGLGTINFTGTNATINAASGNTITIAPNAAQAWQFNGVSLLPITANTEILGSNSLPIKGEYVNGISSVASNTPTLATSGTGCTATLGANSNSVNGSINVTTGGSCTYQLTFGWTQTHTTYCPALQDITQGTIATMASSTSNSVTFKQMVTTTSDTLVYGTCSGN